MVIVNGSFISKAVVFLTLGSPSKVMTGLTELNAIQDTWGPEGLNVESGTVTLKNHGNGGTHVI